MSNWPDEWSKMARERDEWRDLARRLARVVDAAEDYRSSNDVSDDLHEVLDALEPYDVATARAAAPDDGDDL